jgi:FKBP-type peptidyl-prolyl cis-trans isomerase
MLPGKKTLLNVATVLSLAACAPCVATEATAPQLQTEEEKILYAVGLMLSRSLSNYGLGPEHIATVQRGFSDGVLRHAPAVDLETYGPKIEGYLGERRAGETDKEKAAGAAFRERSAGEEGAAKLESGLVYFEQLAGGGAQPAATDTVRVHYRGMLRDGEVFDTSMGEGGEPATFALSSVVPCFSQGIQRMRVGGRSKLVCPSDLAYGDRGFPPMIPPGATLVFEVELLEIVGAGASPVPTP